MPNAAGSRRVLISASLAQLLIDLHARRAHPLRRGRVDLECGGDHPDRYALITNGLTPHRDRATPVGELDRVREHVEERLLQSASVPAYVVPLCSLPTARQPSLLCCPVAFALDPKPTEDERDLARDGAATSATAATVAPCSDLSCP